MSHVPPTFKDRISAIKKQASDLADKVESNGMTDRDLAIGIELYRRYIETLDEIINTYPTLETNVIVKADDRKIKFSNMDDFSNWLAESIE